MHRLRTPILPNCTFLAILFVVLLGSPSRSLGDSAQSGPEARRIVQRGTVEIGGTAGYLQGLDVLTSTSANRSASYVMPRVGMVVSDELGSGYLTGNFALQVEPLYARYVQPFGATAAGGALVAKYNFLSFGRWMPFWDVGAGMLWTDLAPRIREQSTPFNFLLESGPGVQYFATDRLALTVGARFHHISNAGIGDRNLGLNAVLTYVGVSLFLPR